MKTVEQLESENAQLRAQVESLYAKIGRLADTIAALQTQYGVAPSGKAGGILKGSVVNPGDPGHVAGKKH